MQLGITSDGHVVVNPGIDISEPATIRHKRICQVWVEYGKVTFIVDDNRDTELWASRAYVVRNLTRSSHIRLDDMIPILQKRHTARLTLHGWYVILRDHSTAQ